MTKLATLALALAFLGAGCTKDAPSAQPTSISNQAPDDAEPSAPAVDPGAVIDHRSGLIKLPALATVSPGGATKVPVRGYPGSSFHFGAFVDAASYDKFAAAAGLSLFSSIDWDTQMVVYAILDAQTNQLDFADWSVASDGTATFVFDWIGIEPYYENATPAVLAVVSRDGVKTVSYAAKGGKPLGNYRLP